MKRNLRVSDVGEWGLLDLLKRHYSLKDSRVVVGFGDDVAVVDPYPKAKDYLISTVDTLVEGTHFTVGDFDPVLLGKKTIAVNLSDIAAIGGIPEFYLISLAVSGNTRVETIRKIYKGLCQEARKYGVSLINGDTVRSERLVLTLTLFGRKPKKEPLALRSNARPGQKVYITGMPGESGAGLQIILEKRHERQGRSNSRLVTRHLAPTPRIKEARALVQNLDDIAMIDVSDGVMHELSLVSRFSSVGFDIEMPAIPISSALKSYCLRKKEDPLKFALFGGEDYELLFTTATSPARVARIFSENKIRTPVSCIGTVTHGNKIILRDSEGKPLALKDITFQHF